MVTNLRQKRWGWGLWFTAFRISVRRARICSLDIHSLWHPPRPDFTPTISCDIVAEAHTLTAKASSSSPFALPQHAQNHTSSIQFGSSSDSPPQWHKTGSKTTRPSRFCGLQLRVGMAYWQQSCRSTRQQSQNQLRVKVWGLT